MAFEAPSRPSRPGSRGRSALRRALPAAIGPGGPSSSRRREQREARGAAQGGRDGPAAVSGRACRGASSSLSSRARDDDGHATAGAIDAFERAVRDRAIGPGGRAARPVRAARRTPRRAGQRRRRRAGVRARARPDRRCGWRGTRARPTSPAPVYRVKPLPRARLRGLGRALVRGPLAARLQPAVPAPGLAARECACSGALAVLASALLFERIVLDAYGRRARWAAAFFVVAAVGDLWIGRDLVRSRGRRSRSRRCSRSARARAARGAARSPVRGREPGRGRAARARRRDARAAAPLARFPPSCSEARRVVLVLALALLFGEGGYEPYPIRSFAATAVGRARVHLGAAAGAAAAADRGRGCTCSSACSAC